MVHMYIYLQKAVGQFRLNFKGTDRAIYAVYTQRLEQYVHCGHYRTAQLAVSNTRQYLHRSLRDTNS